MRPRHAAPARRPEAGTDAATSAVRGPFPRLAAAWLRLVRRCDGDGDARLNPLRQLGALAFLALWLLAVSGIWLYAVLDTSAGGAYESIQRLSASPWSPGGIVRSLHRYAADAFVLFTALHLLDEAVNGRWRHFRRFSWLTGCVALPLVAASAVGGFWLNWDRLGQFSAVATAEWLDALPLFAQPLSRNFLGTDAVSDRLFSLFVFVHLGVSLLLVFALWFHVQRITRAAVFPPRGVALGAVALLLGLSLLWPVTGEGPADLARAPEQLSLDWILLFAHPLMYATSPAVLWVLTLLGLGALLALPFLPAPPAAPVAVVDAANCNGCRRCFADCPYAAITMVPVAGGDHGQGLARVDPDLCAGCGICAGACPSSTPFRSTATLVSGIDMPQLPVDGLRQRLRRGLEAVRGARPVVVFGCAQGADVTSLSAPDVLALPMICTGQLPPAFIEYGLRDGADGVVVASCRDGACAFRLGARLTAERLSGEREPHLRASVPRERVLRVEADAGEERCLKDAVTLLRRRLQRLEAGASAATGAGRG